MPDKRAADRDLTGDAGNVPTPSQQGSGGGNVARKVGQRDEYKVAEGGDPLPTTVDGRDKPEGGDRPNRPRRP